MLTRNFTFEEHCMLVSETVKELQTTLREVFGLTNILDNVLSQHGCRGAQKTTSRAISSLVLLLIHSLSSCWPLLRESLIGGSILAKVETLDVGKEKNRHYEKAGEA